MKQSQKRLPGWVGGLMLCLFPVAMTLICEFNATQSFSAVWNLLAHRTGTLLFSCILAACIFLFLLALIKRGWIAALVQGVVWFLLSCVEFFKADVSGSHFLPADFVLVTNFGDTVGMAKLRVEPGMVICAVLLAAYIIALWLVGTRLSLRALPRTAVSVGAMGVFLFALLTPTLSSALGVNTDENVNVFVSAAKFSDNGFFAFFADETRALLESTVDDPENYSEEAVEGILSLADAPTGEGEYPNVIVVLSESFTDFRDFERLGVGDVYYENFDIMRESGVGGVAVVPAFGGYTTKSEFEIVSGLPVLNAGDVSSPQDYITVADTEGMPDIWRSFGYKTVYIHPFKAAYYARKTVYPKYGFSELLFRDELPVSDHPYRNYSDDELVFDAAVSAITESESPVYVQIMSMQNHQPYYYGLANGQSELEYYLEGIAHTDVRLGELLEELSALEEPTVLFFIGDHMPFFSSGEENVYTVLGIDDTNCSEVYEQNFAVWANYETDLSGFADGCFSLFYVPHMLLAQAVGEELPEFSSAMLEIKKTVPVYTRPYRPSSEFERNEALDILSYDRLRGAGYSTLGK